MSQEFRYITLPGRLELKNIKLAGGDETPRFEASLCLDGKRVAIASNDGRGGECEVQWLTGPRVGLETRKVAEAIAEQFQQERHPDMTPEMRRYMDPMDTFCFAALSAHEDAKHIRSLVRKGFPFVVLLSQSDGPHDGVAFMGYSGRDTFMKALPSIKEPFYAVVFEAQGQEALNILRNGRRAAFTKKGFPILVEGRDADGDLSWLGLKSVPDEKALRDRAFRHGLILLPAGERALRFYPRYDMEPGAMEEALGLLRRAVEDLVGERASGPVPRGPELRVGKLEARPAMLEAVDLAEDLPLLLHQVVAVEIERYGNLAPYPAEVPEAGRRPLLQYPAETLASTLSNTGACGVALRDRVSQRLVAYALGSPLENHDEVGVREDPRFGENDTFYLQAMAVSPLLRNQAEVEAMVLDLLRERVRSRGFAAISTLIEARLTETGPQWMRDAAVLEVVEDYLQSGIRFIYLQAPC